jgi:2-oxoglutarate dehydrogenase E2 component (dihydrolipoamide succinyltransferase)
MVGMAKAVNDLGRAKAGKLKPDDTQGGTYTVTNVGTFGSVFVRQLSINHKWEF